MGRGFAGRVPHLTGLYKQALMHKGFALLEVLQPCVTFNRVNTFRVVRTKGLSGGGRAGLRPGKRTLGLPQSQGMGSALPIGVIYRHSRPLLEEMHPALRQGGPLVRQKPERPIGQLLADFF